jgi:hypothetical protein
MENTVPTWLFEMAISTLAEIEAAANKAEQEIMAEPELACRSGLATGALIVAGIKAAAAREVLSSVAKAELAV